MIRSVCGGSKPPPYNGYIKQPRHVGEGLDPPFAKRTIRCHREPARATGVAIPRMNVKTLADCHGHTMASILYFNGVDSISISKRLGHAQPSTTTNIYAHIIEEADKKNADIIADVFLKKA